MSIGDIVTSSDISDTAYLPCSHAVKITQSSSSSTTHKTSSKDPGRPAGRTMDANGPLDPKNVTKIHLKHIRLLWIWAYLAYISNSECESSPGIYLEVKMVHLETS